MATSIKSENFSSETFKELLAKFVNKSLVPGESWYLIDCHWYTNMERYFGLDASGEKSLLEPGPIDNSALFLQGSVSELISNMTESVHYTVVCEDVWSLFIETFGIVKNTRPIIRKVISLCDRTHYNVIEVYPLLLTFTDFNNSTTHTFEFSQSDTLAELHKTIRKSFTASSKSEVRLWIKSSSNKYELLSNLNQTCHEAAISSGVTLYVEERNTDGSWPRSNINTESSKSSLITPSSSPLNNLKHNFGGGGSSEGAMADKARPGICGLSNLGNTCFMNSILQGLSNTPPITEYFANDNYVEDINTDNPLGMRGEIAGSFGQLIKNMWSGNYTYIVPRSFKMVVGRFAPQFSGYQQQDSQELLTFLLDGLHEDLNRIKKKPYIELKDSEDRSDDEIAIEAWATYKKRNDSVILDLFHGLLKSTLVCPECSKISVTFDPFCHLSLPLPVRKERLMEVFMVFMDPNKCPTQYKVNVPKNGVVKDLCTALSKLCGVSPLRMIVTDVYNNRFHKIYLGKNELKTILDRDDIFVHEVPDPEDPETIILPVYHRQKASSLAYSPTSQFGHPFFIGVSRTGTTYESLYDTLLKNLSRYVTPPAEGVEWWKNSREEEPPALENEEEDMEEMEDEEKDGFETDNRGPPKLFILNFVNSCGNLELQSIPNIPDRPIVFSGKNYLSLDWHRTAQKLFYNSKIAENCVQDNSTSTSDSLKSNSKKSSVKLEDCLELYTTKEKLGENDAWYCPKCEKHQQATKKFDLWTLPTVLVVSLKRFSYNRYWRDKLDTLVEFPTTHLDMSPYIINQNHGPAIYDLIAVSNHYGGMGGGHYTAYAKNKDDGQWYYFDDSSVMQSSESAVVTKAAYVLFYQRRNGQFQNSLRKGEKGGAGRLLNGNQRNRSGRLSSSSLHSDEEEEEMDTN